MLGPNAFDTALTLSTIPNSSWHWIRSPDLSGHGPAFANQAIIPNRGIMPPVTLNTASLLLLPVTAAATTTSPPAAATTVLASEINETTPVTDCYSIQLTTTNGYRLSTPVSNSSSSPAQNGIPNPVDPSPTTCDTDISSIGKKTGEVYLEPASCLWSTSGLELDQFQLSLHDFPLEQVLQSVETTLSQPTPPPPPAAARPPGLLDLDPTPTLSPPATALGSRNQSIQLSDCKPRLRIVDPLNQASLTETTKFESVSHRIDSDPSCLALNQLKHASCLVSFGQSQDLDGQLNEPGPNPGSIVRSKSEQVEHTGHVCPIGGSVELGSRSSQLVQFHEPDLITSSQTHGSSLQTDLEVNPNLENLGYPNPRPIYLYQQQQQQQHRQQQQQQQQEHPRHHHHNFDQPKPSACDHHPQGYEQHHQWDIKDVKLPKVDHFDAYEQWPTGNCRRVYTQSCERARRHQSGWAMRNTNNHNPQVLKKSCLGVLECSAGCLVQGKTLSLRPAICDKARKKQCNRRCITPGCPGRLILRNCRGHSGYPVTHFWRFANGAVYFEAKGEHDHNRPSLKTFGLSEPDPTPNSSKSPGPEPTLARARIPDPMKPDSIQPNLVDDSDAGDQIHLPNALVYDQTYAGPPDLWIVSNMQPAIGSSRSGTWTGRGKSNLRGGVTKLGRREKKMAGGKPKASKSHPLKLNSLLQTPLEHLVAPNKDVNYRTGELMNTNSNYLNTPPACNSQLTDHGSNTIALVQSVDLMSCSNFNHTYLPDPYPQTRDAGPDSVWYEPQNSGHFNYSTNLVAMSSWSESELCPTRSAVDLALASHHLTSSTDQFKPEQIESTPGQFQILPTFWQLARGQDSELRNFDQPVQLHTDLSHLAPNGLGQQALDSIISPKTSSSTYSSPDWSPSRSAPSNCSAKAVPNSTMTIAGSVVHSEEFVNLQHQNHCQQQHQQSLPHPGIHQSVGPEQLDGMSYSLAGSIDTPEFVMNSLSTTGSPGFLNDSSLSASDWMTPSQQISHWIEPVHNPNTPTPAIQDGATAFSTPAPDTPQRPLSSHKPDLQTWDYPDCHLAPRMTFPEVGDPYYAYCFDDTLQWFSVGQPAVDLHQRDLHQQQQQQQQSNSLEIISESSLFDCNLMPTGRVVPPAQFPSLVDNFEQSVTKSQTHLSDSPPASFNPTRNMIRLDHDQLTEIPALQDHLTHTDPYYITEPNQFPNWPSLADQTTIVTIDSDISSSSRRRDHNVNNHCVYSHEYITSQPAQFELTYWNGDTSTNITTTNTITTTPTTTVPPPPPVAAATTTTTTDYAFHRQCDQFE